MKNTLVIITLVGLIFSCNKLEVPVSPTDVSSDAVFSNINSIKSAEQGLYYKFAGDALGGSPFGPVSYLLTTYMSDDATDFQSGRYPTSNFGGNGIYAWTAAQNGGITNIWTTCYQTIVAANLQIIGIPKAPSTITDANKNLYLGSAYCIRAMCYYQLVRLWGDVPIILETSTNSTPTRSAEKDVMNQVIQDFEKAISLLPATKATNDTSIPNDSWYFHTKYQAEAMLASAYAWVGSKYNDTSVWPKAETVAMDVINNGGYTLVSNAQYSTDVMLRGNNEVIFALPESSKADVLYRGSYQLTNFLMIPVMNGSIYLSEDLVGQFDTSDVRNGLTGGGVSSDKYPSGFGSELYSSTAPTDMVVIRLAEVYLLAAEARFMQNKISGGLTMLNAVRIRALGTAGAYKDADVPDQATAMRNLKLERRLELFCEGGSRFFDLKRWGDADAILKIAHAPNYKGTGYLNLPIPQSELLLNTNLKQYAPWN